MTTAHLFERDSERYWAHHTKEQPYDQGLVGLSGGIFARLGRDVSRIVAFFDDGSYLARGELFERARARAATLRARGVD
ncbi:MAG: hypothetical protein ACP5PJ_04450, partial [Acidimicrobiales bacterium]